MAKEPVIIPSSPNQRDPQAPRHVIFVIGCQRFKIETNTKITPLPSRSAEVIPIDRKRWR